MIQQVQEAWTTKRGLAERYNVSETTIGYWQRQEGLPFTKVKPGQQGAVRYHIESCDAWLLQRQQSGTKK